MIVNIFDESCHPVYLGSESINCPLYADDLVLMSTKAEGLQNCLDKFANYCSKWGLSMNYKKTFKDNDFQ